MSTENVEIVASFPLPPKQFYEHLTEDEIPQMQPPPINPEKLVIFGFDQNLKINDKEDLMLSDDLITELKAKKTEIFDNFKKLLNEIELVQDPSKVNDLIKSIDEPFQSVFNITSKLSTIQATVLLEKRIKADFKEIEEFINE